MARKIDWLAIVGSRSISQEDFCSAILHNPFTIQVGIVSGGARGVDSWAEGWAADRGLLREIFYPEWDKFGKKAGYVRNVKIVKAADAVLAIWDGNSQGTLHTISLATTQNKPIHIINPYRLDEEAISNEIQR